MAGGGRGDLGGRKVREEITVSGTGEDRREVQRVWK